MEISTNLAQGCRIAYGRLRLCLHPHPHTHFPMQVQIPVSITMYNVPERL